MICAVLGPRGTFSEDAAHSYWKADNHLEVAGSIEELFLLLSRGEISDALIPLENSQAGTIEASMLNLAQHELSIQGEIYMPIRQYLMGREVYPLNEIELIISQPAVYAQCNEYINKYMPKARTEICSSTTKAVQIVKNEGKRAAAIGNEKAASLYGLQVIAQDIQNLNNITRFIHVSNMAPKIIEADKASMIFSLANYPGSLFEALKVFTEYNLNLTKIESRPDPAHLNNYCFYVDLDVKGQANRMEELIDKLKKHCLNVKYLGAYPTITRML